MTYLKSDFFSLSTYSALSSMNKTKFHCCYLLHQLHSTNALTLVISVKPFLHLTHRCAAVPRVISNHNITIGTHYSLGCYCYVITKRLIDLRNRPMHRLYTYALAIEGWLKIEWKEDLIFFYYSLMLLIQ